MARRCVITGKGVLSGNNVSHSNRKTRRRFLPNMQNVTFRSPTLGNIHMRVSAHALRTIDHVGGIDAFLLKTPSSRLTGIALTLKRRLQKIMTAAAA